MLLLWLFQSSNLLGMLVFNTNLYTIEKASSLIWWNLDRIWMWSWLLQWKKAQNLKNALFPPSNVGFSHFCGTDFSRTLFGRKMVLGKLCHIPSELLIWRLLVKPGPLEYKPSFLRFFLFDLFQGGYSFKLFSK